MAVAKQERKTIPSSVDIEKLVDLFLDDSFGTQATDKLALGKTESDGRVVTQETSESLQKPLDDLKGEIIERQIGRKFAQVGDELWRSYQGSATPDVLQSELLRMAAEISGMELSPEEEEMFWRRFKEIVDKALEGTGADDSYNVVAAVLVAIKGLTHFGSAVRNLARRLSLRFFDERHIREDIERIAKIDYIAHEDLD